MQTPISTLTTPRLIAEAVTPSCFDEVHRLHSDPLVMKTLSADGNVLSEEATRKHLKRCVEHWEQLGFGLWAFRTKTDRRFIGRGGLMEYDIDGKATIGLAYAVLSPYWNQGFATEMGRASLEVGFRRLGFAEIASWALPVNAASQRVTEKLGFRYERDFQFAGLPHRFCRMPAEAWSA
jgi:ribosomal-protein-alanine N-acetyltransferase